MNDKQNRELNKVRDLLNECRTLLDNAMYASGNMSDEDYSYCRNVYNSVSEIIDMM